MNALVSEEAAAAIKDYAAELDVAVANVLEIICRRIGRRQPIVFDDEFAAEVIAEREARKHAPRPRTHD